jgi:hypothetical protein
MISPIFTHDAPSVDSAESPCRSSAPAPSLPAGLVMLESATGALRAFLNERGLEHYVIFHALDLDLDDVDALLPRLCPSARWEAMPLTAGGDQPLALDDAADADGTWLDGVGVLRLPDFDFALARWHWINGKYGWRRTTTLAAAADRDAYARLRDACVALRRQPRGANWEIVRDANDVEQKPRKPQAWGDLLLAPAVAARVDAEVVGFFKPRVAELYRSMDVPYRRGVLMHGPPGNGKTSIIRAIGASMPDVYGMILRPDAAMGDAELKWVFKRWRRHAPALLVIEDLDHLLKEQINLSHFLNHVDGVEGAPTGGLMMLATTNHPERLDPAISNRPGRFDVVIDVPSPDRGQRREFFVRHLSGAERSAATIDAVVSETAGLSFSHLHEVVRLSGLLAIHEDATERTPEHWTRAAAMVADGGRNARCGFPVNPEVPFGLAQFRKRRDE